LHREFEAAGGDWPDRVDEADRILINNALAHLDSLAFQALRGHVDLEDAVTLWGTAATVCWERAAGYVRARRDSEGHQHLWFWLEEFVKEARRHPEVVMSRRTHRISRWTRWIH
jgi:hypothetical protein